MCSVMRHLKRIEEEEEGEESADSIKMRLDPPLLGSAPGGGGGKEGKGAAWYQKKVSHFR